MFEEVEEGSVVAGEGGGLVAGPVAAADVEAEAVGWEAGDDVVEEACGEIKLGGRGQLFAEGPAHEGAVAAWGAEYDLGENWLVELDEGCAGCEEKVELFSEDTYDVLGEVFTGLVGEVGEAVEPHGAGEEVGAGEGDLDGPVGALGGEFKLVKSERFASAELAVDDRVSHLASGHVQGAQLLFELVGVVDHGGKVG